MDMREVIELKRQLEEELTMLMRICAGRNQQGSGSDK